MADALVLVGPTASGKTALSIDVARRLGGEIISMDSRQVYKGMNIGTAKATPAERALVPHYGLDLLPPSERYSAGRFARDARRWMRDICGRQRLPMLVGGTGFFLRALTHPLFHEPRQDPLRKEALKQYLERLSHQELLRWLHSLDEASALRLTSAGGRQRAARAVEVALLSGRRLSDWHAEQESEQPLDLRIFVLDLPRDLLYARINQRVDQMLASGLVEEVRALEKAGYDERSPGMNATGYLEVLRYLRGELTLDAAAEQIRTATRQFARRQLTWFRHQLPAGAIVLDATRPWHELAEEIQNAWNQ